MSDAAILGQPSDVLILAANGRAAKKRSAAGTWYLLDEGRWEGADHRVILIGLHPEQRRQSPGRRRTVRPAKV